MNRLRYRQVFLFLLILILPTVAIGWQGWRLVNQERDLDRGRAEKQAEESRKRIAAEIGHDLSERLDRIKFQEMANSPAIVPQPGKYSDPAAVVLIGGIDGDKLVWPWDEDSGSIKLPSGYDPEFDHKLSEAGRVEPTEKNRDRAAVLYRSLAETAKNEAQRAEARVGLAQTLRQNGSQAEAAAILRDVLNLPWNVTDVFGYSWATYAAGGLMKLNGSRDVLNRVKRDLESPGALRSTQAKNLKSILESLNMADERMIREEAALALERLASRMSNLEQARSLKEARDLQRDFAGLHVTESDWKPYPGAHNELWLVGRTPQGLSQAPLAVVVRAEAVRKSVETSRVALGGTAFQIVAGGDTGEPAGGNLRDLRIELPAEAVATPASDSGLRQSFYGLSLFVVVPLTFLGGYLLWRDTRRESRVAEMRSQFVSSVSHELKTPLTSIRMFAETLQMADETNSSDVKVRTEYLDTIVSESERLTRLLNNVLDFSRIERDQKTYHMEAADLPEVMDAAVKTMRFPLSEQGFDLHVEISDDIPSLHIDRDAIEQAVLNLLSNAMKYSGKSRHIELKLSRQNGCALIQVSDHGIGIAPVEQRRIFDRFYRVNSSENRAISGTGLGLALVAHIAEAHKGRVEVESKVGEGTTFSIRIPVNGGSAS